MSGTRVITAVRIRPLSSNELASGSVSIVSYDLVSKGIGISHPSIYSASNAISKSDITPERIFNYDYTFWSVNKLDPYFSNQENVFDQIGRPIIENCLQGMNCSLFAYGNVIIVAFIAFMLIILVRSNGIR
jgi:kinesin family protein 1